jgi:hypothetical protein
MMQSIASPMEFESVSLHIKEKFPLIYAPDPTECSEYDIIFSVQYAWSLVCVPQ